MEWGNLINQLLPILFPLSVTGLLGWISAFVSDETLKKFLGPLSEWVNLAAANVNKAKNDAAAQ